MSVQWHWFVVAGVVLSLLAMVALLLSNRKTSGKETTGHTWDGIKELDNPLPMWWVGLFVGSILFAIPFLLYFPGLGDFSGFGNWSSAAAHDKELADKKQRFLPLYNELGALTEAQLHGDSRAQQIGRRLFINHCATCHGSSAQGSFGFPDLTDDVWLWGGGFEAVKTAITHGRTAAMPSWSQQLGPQGIGEVTQYLLKLAGQSFDQDRATLGEQHYAVFCTACHGVGGTGNPALGAPDFTNGTWLYGGNQNQIAFTIEQGRYGGMPAHADILDANRIHILTGYITSLQSGTAK